MAALHLASFIIYVYSLKLSRGSRGLSLGLSLRLSLRFKVYKGKGIRVYTCPLNKSIVFKD